MKKMLALVATLILLAGCDDGEMTFRNFNFTDDDPERCDDQSSTFYKINGTEVLIFELGLQTDLVNVATPIDTPRIVLVDNFIYRNYDGDVARTTLCSNIPPVSPSVIEEWQGEGQLAIVTTPVYDDDEDDGVDRVTGYSHQLTLITATFSKDGEEITITDVNLGTIRRDLGFDFDFESNPATPTVLDRCDNNVNTLYIANGSEALILTLEDEILYSHENEIINLPQEETLLLRVFSSSPGATNICGPIPPITPVEEQRWAAAQGTIEITVVQDGTNFVHTVHLKNVVFQDTGSDAVYTVLPAADYIIGTFTTTE